VDGIAGLPGLNYAFYLFGAAFNWFFLLYVALFSLSIAPSLPDYPICRCVKWVENSAQRRR
jgi:hypothetical protein